MMTMGLKTDLKFVTLLLMLCVSFLSVILSEKILFLILFGTRSHRISMQPLAENLVDRGHDVTFLAETKPEKNDPRIHEVEFDAIFKMIASENVHLGADAVEKRLRGRHYDHLMEGTIWWDIIINAASAFLRSSEFVKFVNTSHYDLIIVATIKEIAVAMAYRMNAKVIWMNTGGALHQVDAETFGLPIESNWLPNFKLGSPYRFVPDHAFTTINTLWQYLFYDLHCLRKLDHLIQQNLGEDVPPLTELLLNVDLVLLNEHFSYSYPRSLPPFVIPIGGMHVKYTNGVLPKEIQDFIDPIDYFVYISFGSLMNFNSLPSELRQHFFDAVASFQNVRFLWKWDGKVPANIPGNVLTEAWFPQQEILAHRKCKGFVTQGGAMSFQQAIYHAVPMIVIPIWWDQPAMARSAVHHGVGIHLELSEITLESLESALHQIIFNGTYEDMSIVLSKRAKDQSMSSIDTAIWWIEYVLRHDTSHLKSPSMRQSWWRKRLLDVWFTVFVVLLIAIFAISKVINYYLRLIVQSMTKRYCSKRVKIS